MTSMPRPLRYAWTLPAGRYTASPGCSDARFSSSDSRTPGSSDNVLRGGLTSKHVDVAELLRTVDFRPVDVPLLSPVHTQMGQELYRPPFGEFQLQRIELEQRAQDSADGYSPAASMSGSDVSVLQNGPTIVIVVRGTVVLDSPKGDLVLETGQSAFIPSAEAPVIAKLSAHSAQHDDGALAFAVTVGSTDGQSNDRDDSAEPLPVF